MVPARCCERQVLGLGGEAVKGVVGVWGRWGCHVGDLRGKVGEVGCFR